MGQRNNSLDLIKIIAMTMVLLLHLKIYTYTPDHQCLLIFSRISGIAIPLFFMVSGYLMAEKDVSWKYSFYKVINILKVTLLVCAAYDLYTFIRYKVLVLSFPKCFLQDSEWWHLWYFGTMIIIYLLLPFLEKIINSKRWKIVLISLISICIIIWLLDIRYHFEYNHVCQTFRLWYFLLYFFLGAYIKKGRINVTVKWFHVLLFVALYTISVLLIPGDGIEYHFGSPLCIMYAFSLFLFVIQLPIESRVVSFLYPTVLPAYLFHTVIIRQVTQKIIYPFVNSHLTNMCFVDCIIIILTLLVVVMISKVITLIPNYSKLFRL